mgnify:CR=1 FL=1
MELEDKISHFNRKVKFQIQNEKNKKNRHSKRSPTKYQLILKKKKKKKTLKTRGYITSMDGICCKLLFSAPIILQLKYSLQFRETYFKKNYSQLYQI